MSRRTVSSHASAATTSRATESEELGTNFGSSGSVGPVESRVRSDVAALVTAHPMGEALAEMAYALARTLDEGAGLATAAVNRELRANLLELAGMVDDDDEDLDAILSTPVPTEVRDEEDT